MRVVLNAVRFGAPLLACHSARPFGTRQWNSALYRVARAPEAAGDTRGAALLLAVILEGATIIALVFEHAGLAWAFVAVMLGAASFTSGRRLRGEGRRPPLRRARRRSSVDDDEDEAPAKE